MADKIGQLYRSPDIVLSPAVWLNWVDVEFYIARSPVVTEIILRLVIARGG